MKLSINVSKFTRINRFQPRSSWFLKDFMLIFMPLALQIQVKSVRSLCFSIISKEHLKISLTSMDSSISLLIP